MQKGENNHDKQSCSLLELLLDALMKEYARALNSGARLGDNDEY